MRISEIYLTKKYFSVIFLLTGFLLFLENCTAPNEDYIRKYFARPVAPSYDVDDVKRMKYLGSKIVDKGVSFNIFSENAERAELLLFDDPDSDYPVQTYEMSRFHNVWSVHVEGIGAGQYYGYRFWGPNWPYDPEWYPGSTIGFLSDYDESGNRYNPNKVLMDPYSRAFHRDHDWTKGAAA